jgi:transcriptional regulator with AAA-type ATPase domain/NAD-dependent dihydropyrimidine dehydrogenase PreA subunit
MQVYKTLQGLKLFKEVATDQLRIISDDCNIITLRTNHPIVSHGDVLKNFFIVISGELAVYVEDEYREKIVLHRLLAEDYYGDICLLTGEPSDVNISSVKKSKVVVFNDEAFQRLIKVIPQLNDQIIKNLSSQIRKINIEKAAAKNKQLALATSILESRSSLKRLVGQSKFTKMLRRTLENQAKHCEPLLITGEKGTGKLLAANLINKQSTRKDLPFIVVDSEELANDEAGNRLLGQFSYLELAQRGTLFLNDIELLPKAALLRLIKYVDQHRDVRIIMASAVNNPDQYIEKRKPGVATYNLFRNSIHLEPLRNRKRDIPELVNYFVNLKCKKYEKETMTPDSNAIEKLLTHDYQQANIQELEEIIDRAVLLTDGEIIEADSIILGQVSQNRSGYNLLGLQCFKELVYQKKWPQRPQLLVTVMFFGILLISLLGGNQNEWINIFTWKVLGPAIIIASLLLGRIVCSVCPFSMLASLAQNLKCYGKQLPTYMKRYYYITIMLLFSLIFWYEEYFSINNSPYLTGLLLVAIAVAAIICGLLFKGHAWCRYLCPLGAIFSVCSPLSIVELRANTDICQNKCQTFNCYKGSSGSGCPMLQHAMYMDSNINCKLCFKCVTNCPNDSIKFSIRPPFQEIWQLSNVHGGIAVLVICFALMLIPPLTLDSLKSLYPDHWRLIFNLFYWLLFCLLAVVAFLLREQISNKTFTPYLKMSLAFVPLISAAHISHQLATKFGELNTISLQLVFSSKQQNFFVSSADNVLQTFVMITGLMVTLYCLFRVLPQLKQRWVGYISLAVSLAYFLLVSTTSNTLLTPLG